MDGHVGHVHSACLIGLDSTEGINLSHVADGLVNRHLLELLGSETALAEGIA